MNVQLEGVQRDGLGVLGDIKVNHDGSVKGQLLEIRLQSDVVVSRDDVGGEQLPALHIDPTSHFGKSLCSAHVVTAVRAMADRCAAKTEGARMRELAMAV